MIYSPDTCHCVIKYDGDFQNLLFLQQCRTHNVPQQTLAHNRSFNLRHGRNPTDVEKIQIEIDRGLEKLKPQFHRR